MHALLIPFGTAGDVHPFLAVANVLRQRGHRVTVVADSAFENLIRHEDLEFECLSKPEESADLLHHPDLWHPTRSYPLIFKRLVAPKIKHVFDVIRGIPYTQTNGSRGFESGAGGPRCLRKTPHADGSRCTFRPCRFRATCTLLLFPVSIYFQDDRRPG
jgi:hypothetical protein